MTTEDNIGVLVSVVRVKYSYDQLVCFRLGASEWEELVCYGVGLVLANGCTAKIID
jgi:hypothetical protein